MRCVVPYGLYADESCCFQALAYIVMANLAYMNVKKQ